MSTYSKPNHKRWAKQNRSFIITSDFIREEYATGEYDRVRSRTQSEGAVGIPPPNDIVSAVRFCRAGFFQ
jgi:hypothetical protein